MSATHELKTWPDFFQAIIDGRKNFEVRYDDRGFQAGDRVVLREWDPNKLTLGLSSKDTQYTGRWLGAKIGYVLHVVPTSHQRLGVTYRPGHNLEGYVVFSLLGVEELSDGE
jgi:hypothetical protein